MKNSINKTGFRLSIVLISAGLTFYSCQDVVEQSSVANFQISTGSIGEQETTGIYVNIPISPPAVDFGKVVVKLESLAKHDTDFLIDKPLSSNIIELMVNKGDTSVGFSVTPIYNSKCGDVNLKFTLNSFSGIIRPGNIRKYDLTILDSDASHISLRGGSGTVNESNDSGIVIHIDISPSANGAKKIFVVTSDSQVGTKYITTPAMIYDPADMSFVLLDIPENSTTLDLKVVPINNSVKEGNHVVEFSLFDSSGGCFKIDSRTRYTLTILDDD